MRLLFGNIKPVATPILCRPTLALHIRRFANIPKAKALVPLKPEEVHRLNTNISAKEAVEGYLMPSQNDGKDWYKQPSPFEYNSLKSFGIFSQHEERTEQSIKQKEIEQYNASIKTILRKIKQLKDSSQQQVFSAKLKEILNDAASGILNPQTHRQYHDIGRTLLETTQQRLRLLEQSLSERSTDLQDFPFEKKSLFGGTVDLDRDLVSLVNLDLDKLAELATTKDPNRIERLYNELEQSFIDGTAFSGTGKPVERIPDWQSKIHEQLTKNRPAIFDVFPKLEDNLRTLESLQHSLHQKIEQKGGSNFPALQDLVTMDGMKKLLRSRYDTDRPLNVNDSLMLERMKAIDPELFQGWWRGPEDALTRMLNSHEKQDQKVLVNETNDETSLPKPEPKPNPLANYVVSDELLSADNLPPTAKDYEDYLDVYMNNPTFRPPDIRQPFSTRNLWYHLLDDAEGFRVRRKLWRRRWKRFRRDHPHSGYYMEDLLTKTYPDKVGFIVRTIHTDSKSLMKHFRPALFPVLGVTGWVPPWERHAEWNNYVREPQPVLGWLPYRWVWLFWIVLFLLAVIFQSLLGALWDEMERRVNIPLYFLIYHTWRVAENFMFAGTIFPQPGMETELVHLLGKPIVADMSLLTAFTIMNKSVMINAPIYGRDRKAYATIEINAKKRGLFKYDWRMSPVIVDFEDGTRVIVEIPDEWALLTPERIEMWKTQAAAGKPDDWSRQFDDPITDFLTAGDVIREWPNTTGYLAIPYEPKPPSADQK